MKDFDWEGPLTAVVWLVAMLILMIDAEKAVGEEQRYIPPTQVEADCTLYIATLAAFIVSPPGSPGEQQAGRAITSAGLMPLTRDAVAYMTVGQQPEKVFPWAYRKCIAIKGEFA